MKYTFNKNQYILLAYIFKDNTPVTAIPTLQTLFILSLYHQGIIPKSKNHYPLTKDLYNSLVYNGFYTIHDLPTYNNYLNYIKHTPDVKNLYYQINLLLCRHLP